MPDADEAGLRFQILGSLRATLGGRPLALGPRKQQLVLAILLCNANCLVPVDALIDALWDERPPRTARKNLQVYVSTLRGLLGSTGAAARITHQLGGYLLEVKVAELDWLEFERRVRESRLLWQQARSAALARELAAALRLWRGPALEGMRGNAAVDAAAEPLESSFLTAFEDWAEAEVATGGALAVVDRIAMVARAHPFRERLRAVQMTALSQLGRRTEALGIYDEVRREFAREFGLSPSAPLTALHQALLSDEQAAGMRPPGKAPPHPRAFSLLPRDLASFTGRASCMAELSDALTVGERLVVLTGPVGAGKTALAVHAAHEMAHRFPDGCFFSRLRYDDGRPRPRAQVLAQLEWAVTEPAVASQPLSIESWQRWLATRRALLIFDDVREEAEVRALLPETGDSAVIITSWTRLPALGPAHRLSVGQLSLAEAMDLLSGIIGQVRVARDRRAAERIVEMGGLWPLAVRAVADKLASISHVPLREYLTRADASGLPDDVAAVEAAARTRLAQAVADLPEPARLAFPRLGMLTRPTFNLQEAAGALGLGEAAALRVLETLLERNVLTAPDAEVVAHSVVYEMPWLTRAYAREVAGGGTGERRPSAAL